MKRWLLACLLAFAGAACGDEETSAVGEVDAALVGSWRGTVDGSFGPGTLTLELRADGRFTGSTTADTISSCPFRSTQWGVRDEVFRMQGIDCSGTNVSFDAPRSETQMRGTWIGRPSGNRGTFDIRRSGGT